MRLEAYRRLAPETRHASLAEGRRRPCTVALLAAELAQGPGRRLKRRRSGCGHLLELWY